MTKQTDEELIEQIYDIATGVSDNETFIRLTDEQLNHAISLIRNHDKQIERYLKDNEIANFVNELLRATEQFAGTQQLRGHLRDVVIRHLPSPPGKLK